MATIVRVSHGHDPYTVIDRRPLEDDRLSWAARGVLGYLLAKPDDWALRIENLRRHGDLGRDALYGILKQLRRYGYVERRVMRDEKGRITETFYIVYEVPRTESPCPDKPDTAHPDTGAPDTDGPDRAQPTPLSNQETKEPEKQVTTNTAPPDAKTADRSSACGGGWHFPDLLSERERLEASTRLESLPDALGQALLDELAGRLSEGALRGSPLAYLRGLVRRAEAGSFTPEAGLAVAEARSRREKMRAAVERAETKAPELRPTRNDPAIAKRLAEIKARATRTKPRDASPEGEDR